MSSVLLIGTAVTRPDAVGALYRSVDGKKWEPAIGVPVKTGVQAFAADPRNPGVVYATARDGVYKSTNNGESWTKLDVPSNNEEFWCVTVHPKDSDIVFVGAAPVGVYRSGDAGKTWRRVGNKEPMPELCDYSKATVTSRLMRIYFDPTNTNLVFGACETNGIIISEDGGETWRDESKALIQLSKDRADLRSKIITPDEEEGILDGHAVLVTPEKPGVVFYACRMGLFSSADKAKSWRNYEVGRFAPFNYCRDLRIVCNDPKTFYMAMSIGSRSNAGALYRSSDLGETWKRVDEPVTAKSTIMSMNVGVTDPGKVIYITRGGQVMWSADGSKTWHESQLPAQAGDGFCAAIL